MGLLFRIFWGVCGGFGCWRAHLVVRGNRTDVEVHCGLGGLELCCCRFLSVVVVWLTFCGLGGFVRFRWGLHLMVRRHRPEGEGHRERRGRRHLVGSVRV